VVEARLVGKPSKPLKQVSDARRIVHRDMQIAGRNAHVGVASGAADLGQSLSPVKACFRQSGRIAGILCENYLQVHS
jgi:hypothetical protein